MKILSPNLETWTLVPLSFKSFSFITFYDQPGGIQEDTGGYRRIQGDTGIQGDKRGTQLWVYLLFTYTSKLSYLALYIVHRYLLYSLHRYLLATVFVKC